MARAERVNINTVRVRVISPDATLFDALALSVAGVNDAGEFTVLPRHINFISLISDRVIIRLSSGERKIIPFEAGVMRCREGIIEVFAGLSLLALK